jgi:hypothetical protein
LPSALFAGYFYAGGGGVIKSLGLCPLSIRFFAVCGLCAFAVIFLIIFMLVFHGD